MSKALPLKNMQDRTSTSKYKSLLEVIREVDETLTGQSSYQLPSKETEINNTFKDWLPMDDGIATKLLGSSSSTGIASRNEMAAYINEFLYGRRRLNRSIMEEIDD